MTQSNLKATKTKQMQDNVEEKPEFSKQNPEQKGDNKMPNEEMAKINMQDYMYPPDALIPVTASLWNLMNQVMNLVVTQEIPVKYDIPSGLSGEMAQKSLLQLAEEGVVKPVRNTASNIGILADAVVTYMSERHMQNIQEGIAVHKSVVEAMVAQQSGKMDLGDKPAQEEVEKVEVPEGDIQEPNEPETVSETQTPEQK